MDMKAQTRNSLLTAMVCVALSSGTAWAAVPEVQVPAVQQSAPAGSAAALAEASVADVVSQEKAKEKVAAIKQKAGDKYFKKDHTHTSKLGAQMNAQSFAKGLRQNNSPLAKYLK